MCVVPSSRHAENLASNRSSRSLHSFEQPEIRARQHVVTACKGTEGTVCVCAYTGGVLKNPYQTVLPAAAFPYPSIDQLRPMTVFDVHCGRYRDITFWDWVKTNMPNVLSIIPH